MFLLYNFIILIAQQLLKIIALFSPKINLFVSGRKKTFTILENKIHKNDKIIWFHAASLGEYEQGLPVMEKIREKFPQHKILLTFFSPSGFEVRKNVNTADIIVYLPLDSISNAKKFIEIVHPEKVFFIKYEYWPNFLNELHKNNIDTYLISGILRKNQAFFKWYGGFYRKSLNAFTHFFVQNSSSKELLNKLGKNNVTISGDTRFDRVSAILNQNNQLEFIENFIQKKITLVIGSSWPKDEEILITFINQTIFDTKIIIAPHNIKPSQILQLKNKINKKTVLFSEKEGKNLAENDVMIIDTIGLLTKIYSYADIAYVGGGFGNPGVHNILEPATFGIPIIIGPNYNHFEEAKALVKIGGCISISNSESFISTIENLLQNEETRLEQGHICETFVQMNNQATRIIMNYINSNS